MTGEDLFKELINCELFKTIDQTDNIKDFLLTRTAAYVAVNESEELQQLHKRKKQYEAEFENDKFKSLPEYLILIEEMDLTSEFLYFQQGFFEGLKFILIMGSFSILPESYLNYLETLKEKER